MYSVSNEYSKAINADIRDVPYRVTLAGSMQVGQSRIPKMVFTENVGDASGVALGTASSALLTFTLKRADAIDYNEMLVEPEGGVVLPDGSIEWVPLGKFWVTDFTTNNDYETVSFSCADGMYLMSGNYESELEYPSNARAVVLEILSKTGVAFNNVNSVPEVPIRRKPEGMTYREAIGYLAGCCGKNARFNRDGQLEFFWYKDSGVTIDRRVQYLDGMTKLNIKPLQVNFEVTGQQETYSVTIVAGDNGGVTATPGQNIEAGETVVLSINPFSGYELANISAVAEDGSAVELLYDADGLNSRSFIQPDSNVTVTASFKSTSGGPYAISLRPYGSGGISTVGGFTQYNKGDTVTLSVTPDEGNEIDKFVTAPAGIALTDLGNGEYRFIMPESDVTINVYFKSSNVDDIGKIGMYSWLQSPDILPLSAEKKYWAVLYKHDSSVPVSQRYRLVWFDSWVAMSKKSDDYGKTLCDIQFARYYYCGCDSSHKWNTSALSGNGAAGSTLEWKIVIDSMWAGDPIYSSNYCLIASNTSLYFRGEKIFQQCASAIQAPQTSYVIGGVDVRERGAFAYKKCPDTFGTPAPASNWMIVYSDNCLLMDVDEDERYTGYGSGWDGLYVIWFDSISVKSIGSVFSNSDEEFYVATVTNGYYTRLVDNGGSWYQLRAVQDGQVIGLRNPAVSEEHTSGMLGGYYFNGLMASSCHIYCGGSVFKYRNDCKVCDCETEVASINTYSLRRSVGDYEIVNIEYTNPLIYGGMVDDVSSHVQGITYTPANVKYRGNPALQAGDIVFVPDKDGVEHTVLVLQQTMTFGGGMNAQISCPGKTEKTKQFSANGPITTQIKQEVAQSSAAVEHRLSSNNALAYASIYKDISSTQAKIALVAQKQTETSDAVASLEQTANEQGAKIALVVGQNGIVNDKGTVQGSIVIEAINGESTAKISADRLDIEGKELNIKVKATNIEGKLTAEQIDATGLKLKMPGSAVDGWNLELVEVPLSANPDNTEQQYALYSPAMQQQEGNDKATYRVYLTPKGVYLAGQHTDENGVQGASYFVHKTWYELLGG